MPVCLQTWLFITQGDLQNIKGRMGGGWLFNRSAMKWQAEEPFGRWQVQVRTLIHKSLAWLPTLVQASYIGKYDLNSELCSFSAFERQTKFFFKKIPEFVVLGWFHLKPWLQIPKVLSSSPRHNAEHTEERRRIEKRQEDSGSPVWSSATQHEPALTSWWWSCV